MFASMIPVTCVKKCIKVQLINTSELDRMIHVYHGENGRHCKDSNLSTCDNDILMTHNNGHKQTTK